MMDELLVGDVVGYSSRFASIAPWLDPQRRGMVIGYKMGADLELRPTVSWDDEELAEPVHPINLRVLRSGPL